MARKGAEYIGTMEVQEKHRFDERSLARFMTAHVEGFVPPLKAEQFKGGQSNPTYRLTDGAGRRYTPEATAGLPGEALAAGARASGSLAFR